MCVCVCVKIIWKPSESMLQLSAGFQNNIICPADAGAGRRNQQEQKKKKAHWRDLISIYHFYISATVRCPVDVFTLRANGSRNPLSENRTKAKNLNPKSSYEAMRKRSQYLMFTNGTQSLRVPQQEPPMTGILLLSPQLCSEGL